MFIVYSGSFFQKNRVGKLSPGTSSFRYVTSPGSQSVLSAPVLSRTPVRRDQIPRVTVTEHECGNIGQRYRPPP